MNLQTASFDDLVDEIVGRYVVAAGAQVRLERLREAVLAIEPAGDAS